MVGVGEGYRYIGAELGQDIDTDINTLGSSIDILAQFNTLDRRRERDVGIEGAVIVSTAMSSPVPVSASIPEVVSSPTPAAASTPHRHQHQLPFRYQHEHRDQ
jgi:hypothetical protein